MWGFSFKQWKNVFFFFYSMTLSSRPMVFWAAISVCRIRLAYYHKRCRSWAHIADDDDDDDDERVPPPLNTHWTHAHMPTRSFSHTTDALMLLCNLLLPTWMENITTLNDYLFILYSFSEKNLVSQNLPRLECSAWSAADVHWVTGVLILIWVG